MTRHLSADCTEEEREARAVDATQLLVIGGAAMDGPRHIEWNFVSSSEDRIARAKDDWKDERFAKIPGDDVEFIPLPESSR